MIRAKYKYIISTLYIRGSRWRERGKGVGMVDRDKGWRKRKGGGTYLASRSFSS